MSDHTRAVDILMNALAAMKHEREYCEGRGADCDRQAEDYRNSVNRIDCEIMDIYSALEALPGGAEALLANRAETSVREG